MSRSRSLCALVSLVLVSVILSGCFPAPHDELEPTRPADSAAAPSVMDALTASGIGVVDDVTAAWPEGSLMVSPSSAVAVMQAEVESGGGMPGADLDDMIPMPESAVPFSYLIAAWLSAPATPRAERARAWILGEPDWSAAPEIWFPRAALLLFAADVMEASIRDFGVAATPSPGAAPGSSHDGLAVAASLHDDFGEAAIPDAPCSAVSGFFGRTIDAVFGAVQLPPDFLAKGGVLGAVSGFLAALYNTAVALAKQAVLAVVESLTAPILHAIGSAVAIVGLVSHLSTYVLGVSLNVSTERVIVLDGHEGNWTAFVDSNRPLEPQLADCLRALGQKPLNKVIEPGTEVTWHRRLPWKADGTVFGRVTLLYTSFTSTVDPREVAILPWVSAQDIESGQPPQYGTVGIQAELPKGDVARMLTTARTLVDEAIAGVAANAGPLSGQVDAAIRRVLSGVIDRIEAEILGVGRSHLMIVGSGITYFEYREPDPPTGPPGEQTAECFVGTWRFDGLVSSNWIEMRRSDFRRFILEIGADGQYRVSARGSVGSFGADYDGSTTFTSTPSASGTWQTTASALTTQYSRQRFGAIVFGQGLSPRALSCSADGATLTVTGAPDRAYGSTVWRFRREG